MRLFHTTFRTQALPRVIINGHSVRVIAVDNGPETLPPDADGLFPLFVKRVYLHKDDWEEDECKYDALLRVQFESIVSQAEIVVEE